MTVRKVANGSVHILRSPLMVLLTAVISISALAWSYENNSRITDSTREQNVFLQETFCGILESVAFTPDGVPGPSTPYGQNQQRKFQEGFAKLQCITTLDKE